MNDKQIAHRFLEQFHDVPEIVSGIVLTAIIGEVRTTERRRCANIAELYTGDDQPGPVQIAAREIRAAIWNGGEG